MTTKETKTESELELILMEEIRRHPECNHVTGVAITRPTDRNWDAAWVCSGPRLAPSIADEIARKLQAQFDLS
jgi:hypothetical protein